MYVIVNAVPTYYSDFATKLILDFALLDSCWRVLLNELVQVFNTHSDSPVASNLCVLLICSLVAVGVSLGAVVVGGWQ
jgi:hypothetical protein